MRLAADRVEVAVVQLHSLSQGLGMAESQLSYCAAQVRRHDPDRFLTTLFASREGREDLCTLYAFNLEVARTREAVKEAALGQIRLQWWRETLDEIYRGESRSHAVAAPLGELVLRCGLSRRHFERLIDTRERDLRDEPPQDLAELEAYADGTSSTLTALALEALGARGSEANAAAADVGIAWALTGLLRAIPFHARQRRSYLPLDLMAKAGVTLDEHFDHGSTTGLAQAVRPVAARAADRIAAARRYRRKLPRSALPALLPATLAEAYLRELRVAGYDPFALAATRSRPRHSIRLALSALLRRY